MIKTLFVSITILCSGLVRAQSDSLPQIMDRGIALHEQGRYELSLVEYRKALKLEPKNAFVNYEMALSYYFMGNKDKAQEHAKVASQEDSENGVQGVILLGTLYDEQGNTKKSIKTYEKALKRFGDYYLIWFNIGVTYSGMEQYEKAAKAFEMSIKNRLDHTSSHYALGTMKQLQGKRAEAMLPMYFFLLLEPDSERSAQAATTIRDLWAQGVDQKSGSEITININSDISKDAMQTSEMMISLLEAGTTTEENEGKPEAELHSEKAGTLFMFLSELDLEKRDDYYTQYYIPFFAKIANSEYMLAFAHYTMQSVSEDSKQWVSSHTDDLEAFFTWLDASE